MRVVGGFHSPVVRFVYEMLCVCYFIRSEMSGFHFPFGDFQHSDACKRGCGVMVDAGSDVSNCISDVDFEV